MTFACILPLLFILSTVFQKLSTTLSMASSNAHAENRHEDGQSEQSSSKSVNETGSQKSQIAST